jgi:hypothetical protein
MSRLLPNREYKSGTGWCFWRWTDVRTEYIVRLHLLKTPWFAICLHWLNTPDPDPHMHDHPVSFLSLILRGGYRERRWGPRFALEHRWFNWVRSTTRHQITVVKPGTVTLCFMGPKVQEWGFYVSGGKKIVWRDYYKLKELADAQAE